MDQKHGGTLGEAELRAIKQLDPELEEHSALNQSAFALLQELLTRVAEMQVTDMPPPLKVAIALLARLANDLRCAGWLAHRGYAVQACTLVASMYEVAYAIAFIGSDNELAQRWIDHDDPISSPWSVRTITRDGLRKLDIPDPDAQATVEYRVYSQLCMAKHANPLFQMEHSYRQRQEGTLSPLVGPDDVEAVRAAQFGMEHAGALAFIAAASFYQEHLRVRLPEDTAAELVTRIEAVGRERKALEGKAKARWGTEDPFPGKWRK